MLNKDVFNKGVEKLIIEYGDRGFTMSKEKSEQWYEYMKKMSDKEYAEQIDRCLMNCKHTPTMADVYEGFEKKKSDNESIYRDMTNYQP